jgi:hypothetical protein
VVDANVAQKRLIAGYLFIVNSHTFEFRSRIL